MSPPTTSCELCAEENHHPLFNFPRMFQAYLACREDKRNAPSALKFELDHEANLMALVSELRERRYRPSTSICFYTLKPKCREVFAADFRDRVVHHLVYNALLPQWERVFIHHSYACRLEKGTHAAAQALQKFLRQLTANGKHPAHFLKMDVQNFFMTIDRRKLFEMLAKRCHDPELLWLLHVIVFHDPTQDYEMQDRDNLRQHLPPHKSLFYAPPFCGLPIGNLTSQFFANVYLNELDQFVKHVLKCRFYLRAEYTLFHFDAEALPKLFATVNSYLGHFQHAQTRRCVKKLWKKFSFIPRFFRVFSHKLARLDQRLRRQRRLKAQVHWLQYQFKGYLCLIEIGCYFEAFNADAQKLAPLLGLRLQKNWRGFASSCGFPRRFLMLNLGKLKRLRIPVVVIRETGRELYRTKERLPYLLLEPK